MKNFLPQLDKIVELLYHPIGFSQDNTNFPDLALQMTSVKAWEGTGNGQQATGGNC